MARTTHHAVLASKIANAPPKTLPATTIQPIVDGSIPNMVNTASTSPKETAPTPAMNRAA